MKGGRRAKIYQVAKFYGVVCGRRTSAAIETELEARFRVFDVDEEWERMFGANPWQPLVAGWCVRDVQADDLLECLARGIPFPFTGDELRITLAAQVTEQNVDVILTRANFHDILCALSSLRERVAWVAKTMCSHRQSTRTEQLPIAILEECFSIGCLVLTCPVFDHQKPRAYFLNHQFAPHVDTVICLAYDIGCWRLAALLPVGGRPPVGTLLYAHLPQFVLRDYAAMFGRPLRRKMR